MWLLLQVGSWTDYSSWFWGRRESISLSVTGPWKWKPDKVRVLVYTKLLEHWSVALVEWPVEGFGDLLFLGISSCLLSDIRHYLFLKSFLKELSFLLSFSNYSLGIRVVFFVVFFYIFFFPLAAQFNLLLKLMVQGNATLKVFFNSNPNHFLCHLQDV